MVAASAANLSPATRPRWRTRCATACTAARILAPSRSSIERHGSQPLRGSASAVAGWCPGPDNISTAMAVTQTPTTTTTTTTVNTPHRMLTPHDPNVPSPDPETETDGGADPESGTPEPPAPPLRRRRRRRPWRVVGVVAVMLLTAFVVSAALVELPYYAFRPGSVRATESLVSVGDETETYDADGSISYTTVSLQQTTLFELVGGWLDDDVDIYPQDEVLGDRDPDENRTLNLALMDTSKEVATQVALEHLGYDVDVSSDGVLVLDVTDGSPADGTLEVADTIVAIGDERLDEPDELERLMEGKEPGDPLRATVEAPDGDEREVEMALGPAPDDPDRGIMGVLVQPRDIEYDFPIDVAIETGDVGGPSAGLAFTLAILDDLTAGELTGGHDIAVTGEILSDGTVGPVGGTGQKAAAVRAAGIEVFVVPTADYADAVGHAGDVQVIGVDTLDEALDALADLGGNADDLPRLGDDEAPPET